MGSNVRGGACFPTAPEAVGSFLATMPPTTVLADGSMVKTFPQVQGLGCDPNVDMCFPPALLVEYFRYTYAPGDPNANVHGYVESPMPAAYYPIEPCEYKGGAEFWGPVLGAFLIAGVVIVCARQIAGIFKRETY